MRKRYFVFVMIVILLVFFTSGCSTKRVSLQYPKPEPVTLSEKGMTLTLNPLEESQLEERYGKRGNPFIAPPSALGFNQMRVFLFSIESMEDVLFVLKTIELRFGEKIKSPENAFHLINYWEGEAEKQGPGDYDPARMRRTIKQNVLPNDFTVKGGTQYEGLLIFQGRLPNHGNSTVVVPAFKESGEHFHDFIFNMEL